MNLSTSVCVSVCVCVCDGSGMFVGWDYRLVPYFILKYWRWEQPGNHKARVIVGLIIHAGHFSRRFTKLLRNNPVSVTRATFVLQFTGPRLCEENV